ncbi:MAG: hypothetical protein KF773_04010 [Deltaproteobacteria bacterium]|nr:hypothetical protein [Deltaproteobacteria bacterium]
MLAAVGGDDAARRDARDAVGDDLDVVACEGRVEVVREEDALAADRVVGCELGAQRGVADLVRELAARDPGVEPRQVRDRQRERAELVGGVDAGARGGVERARSKIANRRSPRRASCIAIPRPPKPAPMIATCSGSVTAASARAPPGAAGARRRGGR